MSKKKRDYILLVISASFFGLILMLFQMFAYKGTAKSAFIFYGSNDYLIEVDFENKKYNINNAELIRYQNVFNDDRYPIIEYENNKITLLGMYKKEGNFQEVVIQVDMDKRSIEIVKEESPLNICSKQGVSRGRPLVCLPNNIYIYFNTKEKNLEI